MAGADVLSRAWQAANLPNFHRNIEDVIVGSTAKFDKHKYLNLEQVSL